MEVLGLIPARKGSKSIKDKNLTLLNGKPLIQYVLDAALKSRTITRILCSTDDERIMTICDERLGIIIQKRPEYLAQDDSNIQDVVEYALKEFPADIVVLLQPTSPFVLPEHIDECVTMLKNGPYYASAQTITEPPHNHHAFNQRIIRCEGGVDFYFNFERKKFYNKQLKPKFYIFGNVVATRTKNIEKGGLFATPSFPVKISYPYAMDIDQPEDIKLAEWYLQTCGF